MIRMPDLAQGLAEEVEHPPGPHVANDGRDEAGDLAGAGEPFPGHPKQFAHYLITRICGWVASSVCVKT